MPNFEHLVKQAWQEVPIGEKRVLGNHTVYRYPKLVIIAHAMPRAELGFRPLEQVKKTLKDSSESFEAIKIVAYPHPKHFKAFRETQTRLARKGPADEYPNSIGSICLFIDNGTASQGHLRVQFQYIQSHYRTNKNSASLSRSLATHYAGWRVRAMHHALQLAREVKAQIIIPPKVLYPRGAPANKKNWKTQVHKELIAICRENGFSISRGKTIPLTRGFIINDKQKSEKKRGK